jgi:putative phosphoesterase
MRIGLISDTHLPSVLRHLDGLGPEAAAFLSTVDLILHGGDVTAPSILDWCAQFAPVLAARGNNDYTDDPRMADIQMLDIEGWRIGMAHELRPESRPIPVILDDALNGERVDILIGGDTQVDRLELSDDVLFINSGSPNLPHHKETRWGTVGLLELRPGYAWSEIICLGETPGKLNPGVPQHIEIEDGRIKSISRDGVPIVEDLLEFSDTPGDA